MIAYILEWLSCSSSLSTHLLHLLLPTDVAREMLEIQPPLEYWNAIGEVRR